MPSLDSSLSTLVQILVTSARDNERHRRELVEHCRDILSSHIGQSRGHADIEHTVDLIKRQLALSDGAVLRFSNLLSRILDQPLLHHKQAILLFLQLLSVESSQEPAGIITSLSLDAHSPLPPVSFDQPHNVVVEEPESTSRRKTKAAILKEHRSRIGRQYISEHSLLRDALYLLQGISGTHVKFSETSKKESFIVFPDEHMSAQTRTLLHRIAEVGHLYSRISSFVQSKEEYAAGTIEQSLCHHLQQQLSDYYRTIATLETQLAMNQSDATGPEEWERHKSQYIGLTLRRLEVWIEEWRLRMRMMSISVENANTVHGGALVSLIHSYTDNGDPFIQDFTDKLLQDVSKPFFSMLQKWLYSGDLHDPYGEFFVAVNPEFSKTNTTTGESVVFTLDQKDVHDPSIGTRLWESKYQFRKDLLPRFLGEPFGRKIFSTGKSLNFIRYSCHDSDWVATRDKLNVAGKNLKYSDIVGLERSIDAAYHIASRRLFEIFFDKFRLLDHLTALKNYLMLSHGDFADQLMESLASSLSRPANTLNRHNLTATLEAAISSSNAQHDPLDVVRRLDARMLEYSHGEIGWDVFTLEYRVDPPIDTVISSEAMVNYMKLFNYIWKVKRIESALTKCWMRIAGGSRTFLKLKDLESKWHQIRLVIGEMIHIIRQMQMYIQIEVVEVRWQNLLAFINQGQGDLDSLIAAHKLYLAELVNKTLMITSKPGKEDTVLERARKIFNVILQYLEAVDAFYNFCLAEAARRDQLQDHLRGIYSPMPMGDSDQSKTNQKHISETVSEYATLFSENALTLVQALQNHTDMDCKNLATRLNFSRHYSSSKDKEPSNKATT